MSCKEEHIETNKKVKDLPIDQGGTGRHKCASYAYERGYSDGLKRKKNINIDDVLDEIEYSQKGERRHRSPLAAYSLGYYEGVIDSYQNA